MTRASPSPFRYAVAGMIGMAAAMGIGRFVYTPLLPAMMDQLGLSAPDAGLIASANYLGYLLGALLAAGGWASGRERRLMLAGLAASTVLAGAMGLTGNLALFLVIRFLAGLASAFVMVFLASTVFAELAKARRNDLQALHFGGVGVGIAASSVMMLVLLAAAAEWQAGWFWSAALSAASLAAVAILIRRGPSAGEARPEPTLPSNPALVRLIVAYGLFGFGYIVTATFLVAIVREGDGGRQFEAIVWLVTGLAGIPSVFVWSRIAARIGLTAAFAAGCIVEAAGVAASVLVGGFAGPVIGGILLGSTFIAITALGLQAARMLAPSAARRVFALMTASFGLGQILGPIFAGILAEATGSFVLPSLAAALALVSSGLAGWSVGPAPRTS